MYHALAQDQSLWRTFLSSKVGFAFVVSFFCVFLSHSYAQSQEVTPPTLTAFSFKQYPQSARRNHFLGGQIYRWFLLCSEHLSASNYPGAAFTPMAIDTSSEPASVAVSWSATDDLAGVQSLQVEFTSPSGGQSRFARQDVAPAIDVSGIVNVTFPPFILEPGTWMARVFVTDVVGNLRSYTAMELAQLGFPTALVVGQEKTLLRL